MENKFRSLVKRLGRLGFSVRPKGGRNIDPVCGMEASGDLFGSEHLDKRYYFCSDHCKQEFDKNPSDYAE